MERQKSKEGDEFWEVTFQIPLENKFSDEEVQSIVEKIYAQFSEAVNVQALSCRVYIDPPRLSVSKQSSGYTIHNVKDQSQIIEKYPIPPESEVLCRTCESLEFDEEGSGQPVVNCTDPPSEHLEFWETGGKITITTCPNYKQTNAKWEMKKVADRLRQERD